MVSEDQKKLIEEINKERALEKETISIKKNYDSVMDLMKMIYNCAINQGFTDYQATTYANTYFNVLLVDTLNKQNAK